MKVIHLLHAVCGRVFYAWALREIPPGHPDVPGIVLRKRQLRDKERRLWASRGPNRREVQLWLK